jgi:hypothetical protein
LEEKLKDQSEGWAKVSQDGYSFKLNNASFQNKSEQRSLPSTTKKPLVKPNTSPLDLLEHHHAKMDYERRKARKIQ